MVSDQDFANLNNFYFDPKFIDTKTLQLQIINCADVFYELVQR